MSPFSANDIRTHSIDGFLENRVHGITSEHLKVFPVFIPVFWCVLIKSLTVMFLHAFISQEGL